MEKNEKRMDWAIRVTGVRGAKTDARFQRCLMFQQIIGLIRGC